MIFPGVRLFPDVAKGEQLFGLSVRQPFASAIIEGPKRLENRGAKPPARLCGGAFWIAVHAGSALFDGAEEEHFTEAPLGLSDGCVFETNDPPLWPDCPPFASMPRRAVLGAARVIGFDDRHDWSVNRDPWAAEGEVRWLLDPTVIRLPVPFPWDKGELGLWCPTGRPSIAKANDPAAIAEAQARRAAFLQLAAALRSARDNPANHRHALAAWHPRS